MSTEVVDRENVDGTPRNKDEVDRELGMVQVLGRLALSLGIFVVAGLAGWIASIYTYETVFLVGLIIPLISVSGALLDHVEAGGAAADRLAHSRRRHRLRSFRAGTCLGRRAVQPGDRVRRVDGGGLRHAVACRRRTRC